MRSIDAGLRGIDGHEHLCREIAGLAVKDDARDFYLIEQGGVLPSEKLESRKPMLAVDDEETGFRILQIPNRFILTKRPEFQNVFREKQDTPRNRRLGLGRLIEVNDFADFP